jgi:putative oxidoreductase
MDPKWAKRVQAAGRVLLAAIFLLSGAGKLAAWKATVAYAAAQGVPAFLLAGATALELGGGLSLLTGYKLRWGTVALLVFLVPVTLVFHNFWAFQGEQQQLQLAMFLKNVAIAGGLLVVLSTEPAGATAVAGSQLPAPGR